MTEDFRKHLEFIQKIIVRMAGNSFLLKGWSVTVTSGLFALSAKDNNPIFAFVALFPSLVFWGLDAYYLRQERLFRRLYDVLIDTTSGESSETIGAFSLDTTSFRKQVPGWIRTLFSASIFWLHGVVVSAIFLTVLVLLVIDLLA
jgi:hypothetical protein